jgi:hypothetical protein
MPLSSNGGGAALDTIQTINSATSTTATVWGSFVDTAFTAASQTLTLPTITAADVGKSITVFNRGTNAFTLAIASGTLTSQIGTTINVGTTVIIKAVSVTSAVISATNAAQSVSSEQGQLVLSTDITIPVGNTLSTNPFTIATIVLPSAGTWEITSDISAALSGLVVSSNQSLMAGLFKATTPTIVIPETQQQLARGQSGNAGTSIGAYNQTSRTYRITTAAAETYLVRGWTPSGFGGFVFGAVASVPTVGQTQFTWKKIDGAIPINPNAVAPAAAGDIKFSGLSADHGGDWILLNGRLKASLTPSQQTVATSLGYGVNIPDMRGRMAVGAGGTLAAAVNSTGGSLSIPQNALPNVTLGGSTGTDPGHTHIQNERYTPNSKPASGQPNWGGDPGAASIFSSNSTGSAGSHSHTLTTSSINGGVTQQNFISPYFANNWFVWLGSSAGVTTLASPMVGANGVTGGASGTVPAPATTDNVNFLRGDGVWAVPSPAAAIVQSFTASGTYTPTAGMKYCIVEAVGGGGGGGATTPCTAGNICVGSGGGSGGYVKVLLTAAQIGASKSVTIGAGGVSGGSGGATAMTGILAASGGGSGASNAPSIFNGRSGGFGGSGSVSIGMTIINKDGEQGLGSFGYVSGTSQVAQQGGGGDSMIGVGAPTFNQGSIGTQNGGGSSALANTGGGGGGAIAAQGVASSNAGGIGGSGKMIITEYF